MRQVRGVLLFDARRRASRTNGRELDGAIVLHEVRKQLRDPDRLTLMVAEMQRHLMQLFKEHAARGSEAPQELKELDARLDRLRKRLKEGDPDMAADELQAATSKRAESCRCTSGSACSAWSRAAVREPGQPGPPGRLRGAECRRPAFST